MEIFKKKIVSYRNNILSRKIDQFFLHETHVHVKNVISVGGAILCSIPSNIPRNPLRSNTYRSRFTPLSPFSPIIFHFLIWLTKQNRRNAGK